MSLGSADCDTWTQRLGVVSEDQNPCRLPRVSFLAAAQGHSVFTDSHPERVNEETFDIPNGQRRVSFRCRDASLAFCGNDDCVVDPLSMTVHGELNGPGCGYFTLCFRRGLVLHYARRWVSGSYMVMFFGS